MFAIVQCSSSLKTIFTHLFVLKMADLNEYKREIPTLKQIKRNLKERVYDTKQHLNNIKTGMLGSNGLAIRESLIEDINSLKEKVAKLEAELRDLTKGE